jgi:glycosyltransferase involved in cell wall biosynthesis
MTNDLSLRDKTLEISHFVGLSGIGGVQRMFFEYIELEINNRKSDKHTIYTAGKVDSQYKIPKKILNIFRFQNLFCLIIDIISRNKVVHFYNNLTSFKVALFLFILPTSKLIVHERGSAWNLSSKYGFILKFISWKADLILVNSIATKNLLEKKFGISKDKIKVLYNGINTSIKSSKLIKNPPNDLAFIVGFIGRLDTPKGVHVLIDSMRQLESESFKLLIAGNGPLENELKKKAYGLMNIEFIGRIDNPYSFLDSIDLLVVPSIREPFGNVCIEAGLCKTPVLAAYIDGIPEIIENNFSGVLIKPTQSISISKDCEGLPLPEFVVDPDSHNLIEPMQINPYELAERIKLLRSNPKKLVEYTENLHNNVISKFSIDKYNARLNNIYLDVIKSEL